MLFELNSRSFLAWTGERMGIAVKNLDVTPETPIPDLPDCDICFARNGAAMPRPEPDCHIGT